MAGEAEFLNHGVELAMAPLLWALQFFQFLGFFLKVSGPDNSDDFSVGRFLSNFSSQYLSNSTLPARETTSIIDSPVFTREQNFLI